MFSKLILSPETIILVSILTGYFLSRKYTEHRDRINKFISDEERLVKVVALHNSSEYEIFHLAAINWNISLPRINHDFKAFIRQGGLPHYVRDYLRKPVSPYRNRRSDGYSA